MPHFAMLKFIYAESGGESPIEGLFGFIDWGLGRLFALDAEVVQPDAKKVLPIVLQ